MNIPVLICFRFDLAQTRRPQPLQKSTPDLKLDFTTKKLFLFAWEELAIEESSPRFGLCWSSKPVKSFLDPSHSARAPRSFLDYSFRNSQRLDRWRKNGFFSFWLRGTRFSFLLKRCSSFWPFHPLVKQLQIEREPIKIYDGCCAS